MRRIPLNLEKTTTVLIWAIAIVVSSGIAIYILWLTVFHVETKKLSISNFYTYPVEVKFNNIDDKLNAFDIKVYDINSKNDFQIVVTDEASKELNKVDVTGLKLPPQLIEVVLSEKNNYCFYSADVTNIYTSQIPEITNVNILTNSAQTNQVIRLYDNVINTYPGLSLFNDAKLLESRKDQRITAYLPITCDNIANNDKLFQNAKLFSNYDAEAQRKYLEDKKQAIQNANSFDQLNSI